MKANYYRLARIYHPDRVSESEKAAAREKFHNLYQAYSILVDPDTRQMYDAGATHTLFAKQTIAAKWECYIRTIESVDIDNARNNYQGSDAEIRDVLREIVNGKGSMTHLFNTIPFMRYEDEQRMIDLIKNAIKLGKIPKMSIRKIRT